jgi:hypothetical protein
MPTRVLKYNTPVKCLKSEFSKLRLNSDLHLKNFCCTAYVHFLQRFCSKLDPRTEKCVFVKYASNKKGYTKWYYTTMDGAFSENITFFYKHFLQGGKFSEEGKFWEHSPYLM